MRRNHLLHVCRSRCSRLAPLACWRTRTTRTVIITAGIVAHSHRYHCCRCRYRWTRALGPRAARCRAAWTRCRRLARAGGWLLRHLLARPHALIVVVIIIIVIIIIVVHLHHVVIALIALIVVIVAVGAPLLLGGRLGGGSRWLAGTAGGRLLGRLAARARRFGRLHLAGLTCCRRLLWCATTTTCPPRRCSCRLAPTSLLAAWRGVAVAAHAEGVVAVASPTPAAAVIIAAGRLLEAVGCGRRRRTWRAT